MKGVPVRRPAPARPRPAPARPRPAPARPAPAPRRPAQAREPARARSWARGRGRAPARRRPPRSRSAARARARGRRLHHRLGLQRVKLDHRLGLERVKLDHGLGVGRLVAEDPVEVGLDRVEPLGRRLRFPGEVELVRALGLRHLLLVDRLRNGRLRFQHELLLRLDLGFQDLLHRHGFLRERLGLGLRARRALRRRGRRGRRGRGRQQGLDRRFRGDGGAHFAARDHADVGDRERVERVGERDDQGAVGIEGERGGAVAARHLGADQAPGPVVDGKLGQVDERQAVALGDRAGELLVADRAVFEQQRLRRLAETPAVGDGLADGVLVGEAELDDHVAEESRATLVRGRRGHPRCVGERSGRGLGPEADAHA